MLRKIMKYLIKLTIFIAIWIGLHYILDEVVQAESTTNYAIVYFGFGAIWNENTRKD